MTINLWGEIPFDENILTPKAVLEAQANELTKQTRGVLEGVVEIDGQSRTTNRVTARMFIKVPALNNYSYEVCAFNYPIVEFYPCIVADPIAGSSEAGNEEELVNDLGRILQSDRVKRAIRGLLAQARS